LTGSYTARLTIEVRFKLKMWFKAILICSAHHYKPPTECKSYVCKLD